MLPDSEKKYNRTLDKTQKKYRQNLCKRLTNMSTKHPKEFWKILNKGKRKTRPNMSLQNLFEFFKNLNTAPSDDIGADLPNLNVEELNQLYYELNIHIEKEEILKCIKKLKNNKARGEDAIIKNEYIKATSDQFIVDYEKLFNLIFESGIVPESWLIGNIIPIYMNKGDSNDLKDFRSITIVCCLCKSFTAVLTERLNKYSDNFLILNKIQCGFRQVYCTMGYIFTLCAFF